MTEKARGLAKNLGLQSNDIAVIFASLQLTDVISEVMKYWLQWRFNYEREGKPSWKTLAKAVHPLRPDIAANIAEKHKGIKSRIF